MTTEKQDMHDGERAGQAAPERLLELLADRAVFGLEAAEEAELAGLLRDHPDTDVEGLDRLAATVAMATGRAADDAVPAAVRARLATDARRHAALRPGVSGGRIVAAAMALLATAAGVLVLVGRGDPQPEQPPASPAPLAPAVAATPAVQREELLATVADAVRLDCAAAAGAAEEGPAAGDVVWSPSRQRGFLRIEGLTANDPAASRYQVWIIDGDRGTPVPGGTFDVQAGGEVVVPILPRGFVEGPRMFAVTLEPADAGRDGAFDREKVVARAE